MKVIFVIPGSEADPVSMVFVKRQVADLAAHVEAKRFFLDSRLNPLRLVTAYVRLLRLCIVERPDILHAQYGTVTAFLTCMVPFVPVVFSVRGSDLNPSPRGGSRLRKGFATFLTQVSSVFARKVFVVSESLRGQLLHKERSVIVPSGVKVDELRSLPPMSVLRNELGWSVQKCYVFFNAGREPLNKRLDLATDYYCKLREQFPELELVVLRGLTPPEEALKMLAASDLVFMTSEREGSPNVVKEALALGVPVVAHDVGDVKQVLALDPASRCLPQGDAPGFLAHANWLIMNRPRGSANMREYSSQAITDRILSAYRDVLRRC